MDLMPAMYAAVQAIADGQIGEAELEARFSNDADQIETTLTVTIRREVRPLNVTHPGLGQGSD